MGEENPRGIFFSIGKTVRTMLALHGFGVRVRVGVGGWIQS
jgi:hypothetical protein